MSLIETPSWKVRPYQKGDETVLVALFERTFKQLISEEHWRWKFDSLPTPIANVWVADTGEALIFQYAGIPLRYQLPDGERVGIVSADTMASPDYRRQGLLTKIGRAVYDQWRDAGLPFVIGLPNEKWGSRTTALGWQDLFPLQWLNLPLAPEKILARKTRLSPLAHASFLGTNWLKYQLRALRPDPTLTIRPVKQVDSSFDDLWQRASRHWQASIIRDSAWVNWRFLTPPRFDYQLICAERNGINVGYLAYRLAEESGRKVGFIAEIFTEPTARDVIHTLLDYGLKQMRAADAETVATLAVQGNWLYAALREAGFLQGKYAFKVMYVPLDSDLPTLHDPQQWFMSGADYDVI